MQPSPRLISQCHQFLVACVFCLGLGLACGDMRRGGIREGKVFLLLYVSVDVEWELRV